MTKTRTVRTATSKLAVKVTRTEMPEKPPKEGKKIISTENGCTHSDMILLNCTWSSFFRSLSPVIFLFHSFTLLLSVCRANEFLFYINFIVNARRRKGAQNPVIDTFIHVVQRFSLQIFYIRENVKYIIDGWRSGERYTMAIGWSQTDGNVQIFSCFEHSHREFRHFHATIFIYSLFSCF